MGLPAGLLLAALTGIGDTPLSALSLALAAVGHFAFVGPRWWPLERAWRDARHVDEAVPVEVVTGEWQPPIVVTTGTGERWTWKPNPARVYSPHVPQRGDDTWTALPLTEGARPTTLTYDRDLSHPRVTTTFRAAKHLTASAPAPQHGEAAPDVRP